MPFFCSSVDLHSGKDIIFKDGNLLDAVLASSAIPGYIQPIKYKGMLLTDGGVSRPIPTQMLIDKGELGDIRYIYSQRVNLGRIRNDVDALWNLAPHDISIIQYWLNNPEPLSVRRSGQDYVQKGIDDVVFMNIEYPDNIMANIHVSWLDPHKIRRMTVVGSEKMVVYDDIAENKIAIFRKLTAFF